MIKSDVFKPFDNSKSVVVSTNNVLSGYDGRNLTNVKPVTQRIDFTNQDDTNIVWNSDKTKVTITHTFNCIPLVTVFDQDNNQITPDIQIIDGTNFSIDFGYAVEGDFYCIISYGTEYGNPSAITTSLTTLAQQAEAAKAEALQAAETLKVAANQCLFVKLGQCSELGRAQQEGSNIFSWEDPDNVVVSNSVLAEWNKTWLVRKEDSFPTSYDDGVKLAETSLALGTKNGYSTYGYNDTTAQDGKTYYYQLFSQSKAGVWNALDANRYLPTTGLNWSMVQGFVRAGRGAQLFPVGTVFYVDHPQYTHSDGTGLWFRVVGHDQINPTNESLSHSMCLQMVDILFNAQYDAPQAYYAITEDTTAQVGKTYYTLQGSTYTALVADTDYTVGDTIPIASWYERNVDTNRSNYGSNNPLQNNLLQWANSDGNAGSWFTKQTLWDQGSSTLINKNGFLRYIDQAFLNVVQPAKLIRAKANVDGGGSLTMNKRFFLLSNMQVFGSTNNGVTQNLYLDYYKNGGSRVKYMKDSSTASIWWLSSPDTGNSHGVCYVTASGTLNGDYAYDSYGVSLACIIA